MFQSLLAKFVTQLALIVSLWGNSLDFMTPALWRLCVPLWLSNRIAIGIHIQLPDERKMQPHLQSKLEICNLSGWKKVCCHFWHFFWGKFPCGPGSTISLPLFGPVKSFMCFELDFAWGFGQRKRPTGSNCRHCSW